MVSKPKKEHVHRAIFGFIALLFIATAFVGVYSFIANKSGSTSQADNGASCPAKTVAEQKPGKNGKYEGAQLVGYTPVDHVGYLQCWDLKKGNGAAVTAASTITATYTGALASTGKIFQSSLDTGQPFTAQLSGGVIQGWTAGLPGMKSGGTRRLLIPARYAYGPQSVAGIPPNSDLVFDVTILAVK
jgi:FKBP-type peptidyl-prolyl cis-trans isomerase